MIKSHRWGRGGGLALICLLCIPSEAEVTFYRIPVKGIIRTADLNGDGFEELILQSDYSLGIYWYSGTGYSKRANEIVTLPLSARLYDVGRLYPGRPAIFFIAPDGLWAMVSEDGKFKKDPIQLIEKKLFQDIVPDGAFGISISPWNFAIDLNRDGLEDCIIPDRDGLHIYIQESGKFLEKQVIADPLRASFSVGGPKRDTLEKPIINPLRLILSKEAWRVADLNSDGLPDIFRDSDTVYIQKPDGTFTLSHPNIQVQKAMLELYRGALPQKPIDIDGDGIRDYYSYHTPTRDLLQLVTQVSIYLGKSDSTIPDKPTQVLIAPNLLVYELPMGDFDRDGDIDIAMFDVALSINKIAQWINIQRGKIAGKLNFFLFNKKKRLYPRKPSFTLKLLLEFDLDAEAVFTGGVYDYVFTMISLKGDFNGDGYPDLLVRDNNRRLSIRYNRKGRTPFPKKADHFFLVPDFRRYEISDLNRDGVSDLILSGLDSGGRLILLSHKP